eukprot:CAMPEP_0194403492 /NCGR_PEP_ID=MMETSP0176-20130528/2110_1 /TAXON_ID=216777 /ORGANISM="Proboscia alata, Strain PI-D3" /LENGTH=86 /DNA_ID=CAMNT_0039201335 /DNA_START=32 /DNA_END=288 /DNA_ORIENTATION=-
MARHDRCHQAATRRVAGGLGHKLQTVLAVLAVARVLLPAVKEDGSIHDGRGERVHVPILVPIGQHSSAVNVAAAAQIIGVLGQPLP